MNLFGVYTQKGMHEWSGMDHYAFLGPLRGWTAKTLLAQRPNNFGMNYGVLVSPAGRLGMYP